MGRTHFSPASFALKAGILALLGLMLLALMSRQASRTQPGQLWRRGFVSGDQIHLLDDKRYVRSRWCYVCSDDVIESGTWAGLGEVISLVPYRSSEAPRLMRMTSRDGNRYLAEPNPSSSGAATEASRYVLVD